MNNTINNKKILTFSKTIKLINGFTNYINKKNQIGGTVRKTDIVKSTSKKIQIKIKPTYLHF